MDNSSAENTKHCESRCFSKRDGKQSFGILEDKISDLEHDLTQLRKNIKYKECLVKLQSEQLRKMEEMQKKILDENKTLSYAKRKAQHEIKNLRTIIKGYEDRKQNTRNTCTGTESDNLMKGSTSASSIETALRQHEITLGAIFALCVYSAHAQEKANLDAIRQEILSLKEKLNAQSFLKHSEESYCSDNSELLQSCVISNCSCQDVCKTEITCLQKVASCKNNENVVKCFNMQNVSVKGRITTCLKKESVSTFKDDLGSASRSCSSKEKRDPEGQNGCSEKEQDESCIIESNTNVDENAKKGRCNSANSQQTRNSEVDCRINDSINAEQTILSSEVGCRISYATNSQTTVRNSQVGCRINAVLTPQESTLKQATSAQEFDGNYVDNTEYSSNCISSQELDGTNAYSSNLKSCISQKIDPNKKSYVSFHANAPNFETSLSGSDVTKQQSFEGNASNLSVSQKANQASSGIDVKSASSSRSQRATGDEDSLSEKEEKDSAHKTGSKSFKPEASKTSSGKSHSNDVNVSSTIANNKNCTAKNDDDLEKIASNNNATASNLDVASDKSAETTEIGENSPESSEVSVPIDGISYQRKLSSAVAVIGVNSAINYTETDLKESGSMRENAIYEKSCAYDNNSLNDADSQKSSDQRDNDDDKKSCGLNAKTSVQKFCQSKTFQADQQSKCRATSANTLSRSDRSCSEVRNKSSQAIRSPHKAASKVDRGSKRDSHNFQQQLKEDNSECSDRGKEEDKGVRESYQTRCVSQPASTTSPNSFASHAKETLSISCGLKHDGVQSNQTNFSGIKSDESQKQKSCTLKQDESSNKMSASSNQELQQENDILKQSLDQLRRSYEETKCRLSEVECKCSKIELEMEIKKRMGSSDDSREEQQNEFPGDVESSDYALEQTQGDDFECDCECECECESVSSALSENAGNQLDTSKLSMKRDGQLQHSNKSFHSAKSSSTSCLCGKNADSNSGLPPRFNEMKQGGLKSCRVNLTALSPSEMKGSDAVRVLRTCFVDKVSCTRATRESNGVFENARFCSAENAKVVKVESTGENAYKSDDQAPNEEQFGSSSAKSNSYIEKTDEARKGSLSNSVIARYPSSSAKPATDSTVSLRGDEILEGNNAERNKSDTFNRNSVASERQKTNGDLDECRCFSDNSTKEDGFEVNERRFDDGTMAACACDADGLLDGGSAAKIDLNKQSVEEAFYEYEATPEKASCKENKAKIADLAKSMDVAYANFTRSCQSNANHHTCKNPNSRPSETSEEHRRSCNNNGSDSMQEENETLRAILAEMAKRCDERQSEMNVRCTEMKAEVTVKRTENVKLQQELRDLKAQLSKLIENLENEMCEARKYYIENDELHFTNNPSNYKDFSKLKLPDFTHMLQKTETCFNTPIIAENNDFIKLPDFSKILKSCAVTATKTRNFKTSFNSEINDVLKAIESGDAPEIHDDDQMLRNVCEEITRCLEKNRSCYAELKRENEILHEGEIKGGLEIHYNVSSVSEEGKSGRKSLGRKSRRVSSSELLRMEEESRDKWRASEAPVKKSKDRTRSESAGGRISEDLMDGKARKERKRSEFAGGKISEDPMNRKMSEYAASEDDVNRNASSSSNRKLSEFAAARKSSKERKASETAQMSQDSIAKNTRDDALSSRLSEEATPRKKSESASRKMSNRRTTQASSINLLKNTRASSLDGKRATTYHNDMPRISQDSLQHDYFFEEDGNYFDAATENHMKQYINDYVDRRMNAQERNYRISVYVEEALIKEICEKSMREILDAIRADNCANIALSNAEDLKEWLVEAFTRLYREVSELKKRDARLIGQYRAEIFELKKQLLFAQFCQEYNCDGEAIQRPGEESASENAHRKTLDAFRVEKLLLHENAGGKSREHDIKLFTDSAQKKSFAVASANRSKSRGSNSLDQIRNKSHAVNFNENVDEFSIYNFDDENASSIDVLRPSSNEEKEDLRRRILSRVYNKDDFRRTYESEIERPSSYDDEEEEGTFRKSRPSSYIKEEEDRMRKSQPNYVNEADDRLRKSRANYLNEVDDRFRKSRANYLNEEDDRLRKSRAAYLNGEEDEGFRKSRASYLPGEEDVSYRKSRPSSYVNGEDDRLRKSRRSYLNEKEEERFKKSRASSFNPSGFAHDTDEYFKYCKCEDDDSEERLSRLYKEERARKTYSNAFNEEERARKTLSNAFNEEERLRKTHSNAFNEEERARKTLSNAFNEEERAGKSRPSAFHEEERSRRSSAYALNEDNRQSMNVQEGLRKSRPSTADFERAKECLCKSRPKSMDEDRKSRASSSRKSRAYEKDALEKYRTSPSTADGSLRKSRSSSPGNDGFTIYGDEEEEEDEEDAFAGRKSGEYFDETDSKQFDSERFVFGTSGLITVHSCKDKTETSKRNCSSKQSRLDKVQRSSSCKRELLSCAEKKTPKSDKARIPSRSSCLDNVQRTCKNRSRPECDKEKCLGETSCLGGVEKRSCCKGNKENFVGEASSLDNAQTRSSCKDRSERVKPGCDKESFVSVTSCLCNIETPSSCKVNSERYKPECNEELFVGVTSCLGYTETRSSCKDESETDKPGCLGNVEKRSSCSERTEQQKFISDSTSQKIAERPRKQSRCIWKNCCATFRKLSSRNSSETSNEESAKLHKKKCSRNDEDDDFNKTCNNVRKTEDSTESADNFDTEAFSSDEISVEYLTQGEEYNRPHRMSVIREEDEEAEKSGNKNCIRKHNLEETATKSRVSDKEDRNNNEYKRKHNFEGTSTRSRDSYEELSNNAKYTRKTSLEDTATKSTDSDEEDGNKNQYKRKHNLPDNDNLARDSDEEVYKLLGRKVRRMNRSQDLDEEEEVAKKGNSGKKPKDKDGKNRVKEDYMIYHFTEELNMAKLKTEDESSNRNNSEKFNSLKDTGNSEKFHNQEDAGNSKKFHFQEDAGNSGKFPPEKQMLALEDQCGTNVKTNKSLRKRKQIYVRYHENYFIENAGEEKVKIIQVLQEKNEQCLEEDPNKAKSFITEEGEEEVEQKRRRQLLAADGNLSSNEIARKRVLNASKVSGKEVLDVDRPESSNNYKEIMSLKTKSLTSPESSNPFHEIIPLTTIEKREATAQEMFQSNSEIFKRGSIEFGQTEDNFNSFKRNDLLMSLLYPDKEERFQQFINPNTSENITVYIAKKHLKRIEELNQMIEAEKAENLNRTRDIEELKASIASLKEANAVLLEGVVRAKDEECERLKRKYLADLEELKCVVKYERNKNAECAKTIAYLIAENGRAAKNAADLKAAIAAERRANFRYAKTIRELKTRVSENATPLASVSDAEELKTLVVFVEEENCAAESARNFHEDCARDIEELKALIDAQKAANLQRIEELQAENATNKFQAENIEERNNLIQELESLNCGLKCDNQAYKNEIAALNAAIETAKAAADEKETLTAIIIAEKEENLQHLKTIEELKSAIALEKQSASNAAKDVEKLLAVNAKRACECEQLKTAISGEKEEKSKHAKEVENLRALLDAESAKNALLLKELERLKASNAIDADVSVKRLKENEELRVSLEAEREKNRECVKTIAELKSAVELEQDANCKHVEVIKDLEVRVEREKKENAKNADDFETIITVEKEENLRMLNLNDELKTLVKAEKEANLKVLKNNDDLRAMLHAETQENADLLKKYEALKAQIKCEKIKELQALLERERKEHSNAVRALEDRLKCDGEIITSLKQSIEAQSAENASLIEELKTGEVKLKQEICDLKGGNNCGKIAELIGKVERLKKELSRYKNFDDLKTQGELKTKIIEQLNSECTALTCKLNAYKEELSQKEKCIEELKGRTEESAQKEKVETSYKEQLTKKEKLIEELQVVASSNKQQLAEKDKLMEELKEQLQMVETSYKDQLAQKEKLIEELQVVETSYKQQLAQKDDLLQELNVVESSYKQQLAQKDDLLEELNVVESSYKQQLAEKDQLLEELKDQLQLEVSAYNHQLGKKETLVKELQDKLVECKNAECECENLRLKISELERTVVGLKTENRKEETERSSCVECLQAAVFELRKENQEVVKEIDELRKENCELKRWKNENNAAISKLTEELKKCKNERSTNFAKEKGNKAENAGNVESRKSCKENDELLKQPQNSDNPTTSGKQKKNDENDENNVERLQWIIGELRREISELKQSKNQLQTENETNNTCLKRKILALTNEITQMKSTNAELETQISQLNQLKNFGGVSEGLNVTTNLTGRYQEMMAKYNQQNRELESQNAFMKAKIGVIEDLKQQLLEKERVIADLRGNLKRTVTFENGDCLREKLLEKERVIAGMELRINELEEKNVCLSMKSSKENGLICRYKRELCERENTIVELRGEVNRANAQKRELLEKERVIKELRRSIDCENKKELDSGKEQLLVTELKTQIGDLKAELSKRDTLIVELKSSVETMGSAEQDLKAELSSKDALIANFQKMESDLKADLSKKETLMADLKGRIVEMESLERALKADLLHKDSIIAGLKNTNAERELSEKERIIREINKELSELNFCRDDLTKNERLIAELRVELTSLQDNKKLLLEKEARIIKLNAELHEMSAKYECLKKDYVKVTCEREHLMFESDDYKNANASRQNELLAIIAGLKAKIRDIEAFNNSEENRKCCMGDCREKLAQKERVIEEFQRDLKQLREVKNALEADYAYLRSEHECVRGKLADAKTAMDKRAIANAADFVKCELRKTEDFVNAQLCAKSCLDKKCADSAKTYTVNERVLCVGDPMKANCSKRSANTGCSSSKKIVYMGGRKLGDANCQQERYANESNADKLSANTTAIVFNTMPWEDEDAF